MRIASLSLKNFRNIQECILYPDPGINLFLGQNAQGKTSILEAIGFLATLRSFRRAKPPELLKNDESLCDSRCRVVSHDFMEADWNSDLQVVFIRDPEKGTVSKTAFVNGKSCPSVSQYLSHRSKELGGSFGAGFHAVTFNPSDHELIRGEPKLRRDFLNQVISAEDLDYLSKYRRLQKILEQRNAVLRSGDPRLRSSLAPFNEQLDELAPEVTWKRIKWLHRLSERLNSVLHRIAPEQQEIRLIYECKWIPKNHEIFINNKLLDGIYFSGQGHIPSLEDLIKEFKIYRLSLERAEWAAQTTLLGPNRDDLGILLGDQPLKAKGSQGEVRSTLLALKLCEIEQFHEKTGLKPVFLLDDFSSELDRVRRKFLLNFIVETDLQVFVTATEKIESIGKFFQVSSGRITMASSMEAQPQVVK